MALNSNNHILSLTVAVGQGLFSGLFAVLVSLCGVWLSALLQELMDDCNFFDTPFIKTRGHLLLPVDLSWPVTVLTFRGIQKK